MYIHAACDSMVHEHEMWCYKKVVLTSFIYSYFVFSLPSDPMRNVHGHFRDERVRTTRGVQGHYADEAENVPGQQVAAGLAYPARVHHQPAICDRSFRTLQVEEIIDHVPRSRPRRRVRHHRTLYFYKYTPYIIMFVLSATYCCVYHFIRWHPLVVFSARL